MILLGISYLVVIGGDGSLTGANIFCQEWKSYIEELLQNGIIYYMVLSIFVLSENCYDTYRRNKSNDFGKVRSPIFGRNCRIN